MADNLKERIQELKAAAEALKGVKSGCDITHADPRFVDFILKCAPANVLALIDEIERLAKVELIYQNESGIGDPFVEVMVNGVQYDKVWAYMDREQRADGQWHSVVRFRR